MSEGRVEAIYITAAHGELPRAVESVRAIAGKGLVHRAGLNAEILVGGELRPGDPVVPL